MATGQQAFKGTSRASIIAAVLEHDPELLSAARLKTDAVRPDLSGGQPPMPWMLDQIVARCLAKDPGDWFQTAVDLRQALRWMAESRIRRRRRRHSHRSRAAGATTASHRSPLVRWLSSQCGGRGDV